MLITTRYLPEPIQARAPAPLGPFRLVQPSHRNAGELTQDQRLIQAKQDARVRALLEDRATKALRRRFTGEPITNFGALA